MKDEFYWVQWEPEGRWEIAFWNGLWYSIGYEGCPNPPYLILPQGIKRPI